MLSEEAKAEATIKDSERYRRNRITFLEQMLYDAKSVPQMERAIENLEKSHATERERWSNANNKLATLVDKLRTQLAEAHDARIAAEETRAKADEAAAKPLATANLSIEFYRAPTLNRWFTTTLFVPLPKALQVPIPRRHDEAGEPHKACICEVCKFFDTHQQKREACGYVSSWDTLVIGLKRRVPGQTIAAGRTTTCHFPAINDEYLSLIPDHIVKGAFDGFV